MKLFHKSYATKTKTRAAHAIHVCERFKV